MQNICAHLYIHLLQYTSITEQIENETLRFCHSNINGFSLKSLFPSAVMLGF